MTAGEKYDYVIIGAGIAGLSAAYHLGKDGHKVLVLEADDGKNSASLASTAEMNHDPDAEWDKIIAKFGIERAQLLWQLCEDGIELMTEFAHESGEEHFSAGRVAGYFYSYKQSETDAVTSRQVLQKRFEQYKSIGANVSLAEGESAEKIFPSFNAVLTTHGEGETNNQKLLERLAHEVRENGGIILHNQKVTSIAGEIVITEKGSEFSGTHIIIANGDGAGFLSHAFSESLEISAIEIERKRTFVVSYEKHDLPEFFKNSVMWDTDAPYHYTRSFAGNRLWVGGEDVYEAEYVQSEKADEEKYAAIDAYARKVLHTDDSYKRQAAWTGLFYPAKRGLPYIGEIPNTSVILNIGFGGTGIITSFLSGYLIAAWKRGEMLEFKNFLHQIGLKIELTENSLT